MFDKNSKFPRFFILMLVPIAIIMLVGMFFSAKIVGNAYLIAVVIAFVFLLLDKYLGEKLTNYKLLYFLLDLINLVAVIAITYYEYKNHTMVLNIFLVVLMAVLVFLLFTDILLVNNKDFTKRATVFIGLVKLGAMICILTYFYNVSDLFFVIDALIFELANITIKTVFGTVKKPKKEDSNNEFDLVSIIRSTEEEGDLD